MNYNMSCIIFLLCTFITGTFSVKSTDAGYYYDKMKSGISMVSSTVTTSYKRLSSSTASKPPVRVSMEIELPRLPGPPVPPKCDHSYSRPPLDQRILYVVNAGSRIINERNEDCNAFCTSIFYNKSGTYDSQTFRCVCTKHEYIVETTGSSICEHPLEYKWASICQMTFTRTQNCDILCRGESVAFLNIPIFKKEMHFGVYYEDNTGKNCACFPITARVMSIFASDVEQTGSDDDQEIRCLLKCFTLNNSNEDKDDPQFGKRSYSGYYVPMVFRHRTSTNIIMDDWPCQCYNLFKGSLSVPYQERSFINDTDTYFEQ